MKVVLVDRDSAIVESLIDEPSSSDQRILIRGNRRNAVLVSAKNWSAIRETLFLLSIPGTRESIKTGIDEHPSGRLER